MDNNNNSVDNLDIENDPDVELPIRGSEDKESRMTEANSIAGDIIDDEDQIQDNEGSEFRDEVFSTTQGRTEELSTLGCREISDSAPQPQNISDEHKKSTVCWYCGKSFDTSKIRTQHNIHFFKGFP